MNLSDRVASAAGRPRLLVDARKAFDSGIGTYIRQVLPRVLQRLQGEWLARVLIAEGSAMKHDYLHACGLAVECVELRASPLGLREQAAFGRVLGRDDCFWATSLAHPIFTRHPMVATVHDVAQLALPTAAMGGHLVRQAARLYFASLRGSARALVFDSAFTQSQFRCHVGETAATQSVVHLGVAQEWFDAGEASPPSGAIRQAPPYLVCVGNLRAHKNLVALIQAFDMVKHRVPHELLLVGRGDGFRHGGASIQDALARVGNRARWLGELGGAELRACVAGADAMVLPSLYEGFGLPALEAMAAGCTVLVSDIGAHREVCGGAVRYFDPQSAASLAELLLAHVDLAATERLTRRAGGIQRAREFSWDHTAARMVAVLERVVGHRR